MRLREEKLYNEFLGIRSPNVSSDNNGCCRSGVCIMGRLVKKGTKKDETLRGKCSWTVLSGP